MSLIASPRLHQNKGSVLETEPAIEPVDSSEMATLLGLDCIPPNLELLDGMISEARQEIEDRSSVAMINQTWRLSLDAWPSGREEWWDGVREGAISELRASGYSWVELPRWPLSSVTSVTTYTGSGAGTAVTVASVFDVDTYRRPGRMALKSGETWPTALRDTNAIQILYVAGFGTTTASVPAPLRRAVKNMVAYMFTHRGDMCDAGDAFDKSGAGDVIGGYKVKRI